MAAHIYVNEPPTFDTQGEMGLMTLKSGDAEYTFALSFHALCGGVYGWRSCVDAVCAVTREGNLILFKREDTGRIEATREVPGQPKPRRT